MEGRLDLLFYKLNRSFKNAVYVKDIADIKGGKRLPKGHHYIQDNRGYKYLRVKDIQDNDVDYSSLYNITEKTFQILNRYELNFGELFISIAGTIGKIGCFNKLLEDKSSINPKYLKYILQSDVIQEQIEANYIQTTIPKLGLDRIGKLKIPLLPKEIQQQIIDVMNNAYLDKRAKEKQANELLSSIDTYILNELGITLPERDTSMEARMFQTTFRQVSGRRFDPKLFDTHSQNLFATIKNVKYPKEPLKKLIIHSIAGDWGIDEEMEVKENKYDTCLVIRATEFDNLYNLKLENSRVRYRKIKKDRIKQLDIQP
ncbi:MAG: restriction endonuclease subunit S [Ekhidna sp.]|nr:restriction endonuclease subunit S [Ekhidna sp.]